MEKLDGKSTVEAKHILECVYKSHSTTAQNYHSDNGISNTKIFKDTVSNAVKTLSFRGVNSHKQNGR